METAEFTKLYGDAVNGGTVTFNDILCKVTYGNNTVQLLPVEQTESAQLAIKLTFILLPIAIMVLGIIIACRYKLTKNLQQKIVEANALEEKDGDEFKQMREELLKQL